MTTLADMALKVAREVTDVMDGAATAGAATSLTDTTSLTQPNGHWDLGTLFIRSGTHSGKVLAVTGYAASKLTFASLGATPIAAATRYAVMRGAYPFYQIITAIMQALDTPSAHVTGEDYALVGDGETLEFTLPAGVYNVKRVQFERAAYGIERMHSTHWREINGKLRFDDGYPPVDDDIIHVYYRKAHTELTTYSDIISDEINTEWLRYKAAEQLLWWGIGVYGGSQEYRLEERMNKVMTALKGKQARRDGPDIVVHTAGVYS
jgi:hypothetical protein